MIQAEPIVVLLVEDDIAHAEIVRRNFDDFSVANRIVNVTDGQAALDYLMHKDVYADFAAHPRPSLVLLDLRLPKVDGIEVLRVMKSEETLRCIPVVVLTTSESDVDMSNAYRYGACSYLVKPVDFEKFTQLLNAFSCYWLSWNRYPE